MIARVTTANNPPGQIDEAVQFFQDVGIPACIGAAGFKAAYFLVDRASGKWVEVSIWDSQEADVEAMTAGAQRMEGNEEAQMIGARIHAGVISSEYFEVGAEVTASPAPRGS